MARRFRRLLYVVGGIAVLGGGAVGVGCTLSGPRWSGPQTDHFNGRAFVTPRAPKKVGGFDDAQGLLAVLKWQTSRERGQWKARRDEPVGPKPPDQVTSGVRVTFINHATTLVQLDGVNVLTDPIYSDRCSPFAFAGPQRVRPPGIRFEDLPPIDGVVLSHNHYDHFDVATLKRIADTWPGVTFFVGLGNRALLVANGFDGAHVVELDWWQSRPLKSLTVTSVPNQHFSNRGISDADATLWTSWVLSGSQAKAYFAGDTGYGGHFWAAGQKLGPFDVAILPIGAYKPEWFMGPIHMSPSQAVQAALDLETKAAVPMHYGTFDLADDGETEPLEVLAEVLKGKPAPFVVLGFGEGKTFGVE